MNNKYQNFSRKILLQKLYLFVDPKHDELDFYLKSCMRRGNHLRRKCHYIMSDLFNKHSKIRIRKHQTMEK